MNRRAPPGFSALMLLAMALLGVSLTLWHRYQSADVPIAKQAEDDARPNSGESTVPPSKSRSSQSASASIEPAILPQPVVLPLQIAQPDDLYRALQESNDPQGKRHIRKQLAALKPGEIPFRFALAKYGTANSEEEKLHLQSILAQIDVSGFTHEVAVTASQTQDEALFVSLAYALRNSTSILARQELLNLAANNQLPSVRANSLMANQGLVALHRCLLDSLRPSDLVWINEYLQSHSLNTVQERILSDFIAKTEQAMHRP